MRTRIGAVLAAAAAGALVAACGGNDEGANEPEPRASVAAPAPAAPVEAAPEGPPEVGDTVVLQGIGIKVAGAKTSKTFGSAFSQQYVATGTFVVVELVLSNRRGRPANAIKETKIRLVDGGGKVHEAAALSITISAEPRDDVDEMTLMFDVRPKNVAGAKLRVAVAQAKAQFELGLG